MKNSGDVLISDYRLYNQSKRSLDHARNLRGASLAPKPWPKGEDFPNTNLKPQSFFINGIIAQYSSTVQ